MKRTKLERHTPLKRWTPPATSRACRVCGGSYRPNSSAQRYCSAACRQAAMLARTVDLRCERCGCEFTRPRGRAPRFCSPECANRATATRRAAVLRKPKPRTICARCGVEFEHEKQSGAKRRYCSRPCARAGRPSRAGGWGLKAKGEAACRNCGAGASHLHHIVPRSKSQAASGDWVRNGIPLCATCHRSWHDRIIVISHSVMSDDEFRFVVELAGSSWVERNYPDSPVAALLALDRVVRGEHLPHPSGHEPLRARSLRLCGVEWLPEPPITGAREAA